MAEKQDGFFSTCASSTVGREGLLRALKTQQPFPESACTCLLALAFFVGEAPASLAARRNGVRLRTRTAGCPAPERRRAQR
jgi:hypothetical protein